MAATIFDCFSKTYAINLPERTDRLKALVSELASQKIRVDDRRLAVFPGVRPEAAGGFPNRGVAGCFLSHLAVLRRALKERLESVLVLEDDVMFSPRLGERTPAVARELRQVDWGFVYLGHVLRIKPTADRCLIPCSDEILTAHCYGVRASVIPVLVEFLEAVLGRPPGHPDGGPMFIDGALSSFRVRHPEIRTLVAAPSLASQRPSRSDLTPRWFDRIPGLRTMADWLRLLRNSRSA
jgi:glycosyl transferase, family 25